MLKVVGEVQVVSWSACQAAQLMLEVHAPLMSEAEHDSSSPVESVFSLQPPNIKHFQMGVYLSRINIYTTNSDGYHMLQDLL